LGWRPARMQMSDASREQSDGADDSAPERVANLESFRRQLQALSAEYRSALPERLAQIECLWRELAGGILHPARMADLQRELHTLAGSAKTFGVAEIGEAAAAAESFIEPFCAQAALPDSAGRAEFTRLLDALKQCAATS
jgi:HPt (histidine-containing phosphotransfer) domain-containing protein